MFFILIMRVLNGSGPTSDLMAGIERVEFRDLATVLKIHFNLFLRKNDTVRSEEGIHNSVGILYEGALCEDLISNREERKPSVGGRIVRDLCVTVETREGQLVKDKTERSPSTVNRGEVRSELVAFAFQHEISKS